MFIILSCNHLTYVADYLLKAPTPAPTTSIFGAPAPATGGLFGAPGESHKMCQLSNFDVSNNPTEYHLFTITCLFTAPAPTGGLFGAPAPAAPAFGSPAPAFGGEVMLLNFFRLTKHYLANLTQITLK